MQKLRTYNDVQSRTHCRQHTHRIFTHFESLTTTHNCVSNCKEQLQTTPFTSKSVEILSTRLQKADHPRIVFTEMLCLRIGNLKSAHACSWGPAWLQVYIVIPWTSEMDLPSLHLQRDCTMSVTKGVAGWDFTLFVFVTLTLTRWPWYTNLTRSFEDVNRSRLSKVRALYTDKRTHRQMCPNALPRSIPGW